MALVLQDGRRVMMPFTIKNTGGMPGSFRIQARIVRPDRTWDSYSGRFWAESDVTPQNAAYRHDYLDVDNLLGGSKVVKIMYSATLGPLSLVGPSGMYLNVLFRVTRKSDGMVFPFTFSNVLQLP